MSPIKKNPNNKFKKKNLKPHARKHKQDNLDLFSPQCTYLNTRSWHVARILTWLVKCKGKHICSAKPALLDFDKLAQIALVLQSRMG